MKSILRVFASTVRRHGTSFVIALLFCAGHAGAAEPAIKHRLLFFEYGQGPNRMLELDADGKVVWEHKPPSIAVVFQVLTNGHIPYAYGGRPTGVREVTREKKVVWKWDDHSVIKSLTTVRTLEK